MADVNAAKARVAMMDKLAKKSIAKDKAGTGSDFEVKIRGGWTAGVVDEKRSIVVESSGIYTPGESCLVHVVDGI